MKDGNMKIRIRYRFTGYVQGVGFRFRAYHAARLLGLAGWVQNEPDGSVTVEVQGERREIDAMLEMIERGRYIGIDHVDSEKLPVDPDEYSFEIKD
ncbi:putative Acylphosphate phosphohydrolase [Ruminococcaceae bacterium BL-6]|nr:putative Acylphosphate phosphohydrolase [Ruminococcaceae bacterium BL-6]